MTSVRAFFQYRNEAWLIPPTGAVYKTGLNGLRLQVDPTVLQSVAESVRAKHREARVRRTKWLRSHSKVTIRDLAPGDKGQSMNVTLDEHITWVYRDGRDYGVEGRVIHHNQRWNVQGDRWHLSEDSMPGESISASLRTNQDTWVIPPAVPLRAPLSSGRACTTYDRLRAVRYADLWWNGYNPAFARMAVDCTNFISQCLWAGNVKMRGAGDRSSGWWYKFGSNASSAGWSYSWSTSHALMLFLRNQLGAHVVASARELKAGDVIFYDWEGNGQYHHSTIVTDFDASGDPLVNAHTDASFHRHFAYLDSRAWTPRTKYVFVSLPESVC